MAHVVEEVFHARSVHPVESTIIILESPGVERGVCNEIVYASESDEWEAEKITPASVNYVHILLWSHSALQNLNNEELRK